LTDSRFVADFLTFPWALGGALYIFGAILYMFKIPERFKPGHFDIFVRTPVSSLICVYRAAPTNCFISLS
jgi:predicted membrane channel-forming protein YqfA (hemolysin III family)